MERVNVLIVGAGPAGLAMAAALGRRRVPYVLIEAADKVAASWRRHYDRLHLHTVKAHSALPGLPFPDDVPRYPSREQVIAYLERYAARFDVKPRFGERLEHARAAPQGAVGEAGWEVRTSGRSYQARQLVLATGLNREAVRPEWPDQALFRGRILHAADYGNGSPFRGARALVVGMGNTGAEIALDLHEHGAQATLSVRTPQNILPREFLGRPLQVTSLRTRFLPVPVRDSLGRITSRLAFGDLSPFGLPAPRHGPVTQMLKYGRTPVLDVGTVARIRTGDIRVIPGLAAFTPSGVRCVDGSLHDVDAVILATGYRAALGKLIDAPGMFDDNGCPVDDADRASGTSRGTRPAGIHFIGYRNALTGLLRQVGIEAERVARMIAG